MTAEDESAGEEPPLSADADPVPLPIETVLDLHSFPPKEVASLVEEYLAEAHRAGFTEIRIIHGRGIGVQREIVRSVLARTPFVLSFQDAPAGWGGWGATVAELAPNDTENR
jgi:dsDNA-specific endonuclease/ATPase MutS2